MKRCSSWTRRGALRPVAWSTLVLVSGCGVLLDLDPASQNEPCSSDGNCPEPEFCIDGSCHDSCHTDYSCPVGTTCTSVNSHLACLPFDDASVREAGAPEVDASEPKVESGNSTAAGGDESDASEPKVESGNSTEASGDGQGDESDAACVACSGSEQCVEGECRAILWSLPDSTSTDEPQPAPIGDRLYRSVDASDLYAQHLRVTYSGLLVRLGVLLSTNARTASFGLRLYTDNGGYPLHPIGTPPPPQVNVMTADGSGRQELVISPPVHLDVGNYWVAFVSQEASFVFQSPGGMIDTAEAPVPDAGDPWLDPFPSSSNPPVPSQDNAVMMYAVVAIDH